ncbi:MAG TPA: amidohydrolase family protein, partial [Nitrospiria bacterium]|nr:amidohydrolase family protein [Nitrospiria bacterium]
MKKDTPKVIDADGHILEPSNLWEEYMEERDLLPLAPRFFIDEAGVQQCSLEGQVLPRGVIGLAGRNAGKQITPETSKQLWDEQQPGGFNPHERIKDLDLEGVDTAVLYPTIGLRFCGISDFRLATAVCRAYNNWLADYCKAYPGRLIGVGTVPFQDPQSAIAEMRRVHEKLGFKAVFIRPNPLLGRNLDHPDYHPFWQAAQEIGCPVGFHEGGFSKKISTIGADRFTNLAYRHMLGHAMEQQIACMTMILGGVLEKFPRLKVVFLEAGGGWLPYWLDRMDHHRERLGWMVPDCKLKPTEYFKRQCMISVDPDEKTIPMVAELVGD